MLLDRALRPAVLLLFAGGVIFALVGWRVLVLEQRERERRALRSTELAVARGKADAELLVRTPRGKPTAAWQIETEVPGIAAGEVAEGYWDRLRRAAGYEQQPEEALARYDALLHPELPTWVQDIAALRSAVILNHLRRFEASRRRLGRAAEASPFLTGMDGERVRYAALRYLALQDAPRRSYGSLRRLLDEADDGGRLVADEVVGPGRTLLRLADELRRAGVWRDDAEAFRRLDRAVNRAREGLRVLAALDGVPSRLLDGQLAWRGGGRIALFPLTALMQPTLPSAERGYDLVVLDPARPLPPRAVRLAPPLAGVAVVPRTPDGAPGPGPWLAIAFGVGLLAYVVGAGAALLGWGRSVRAARQQAHFTAAVSHEMKTPIASVRAMAELLATTPDGDASKTRVYGERIDREMQRLGGTVRGVLDAARIERGTFGVHLAPHDPAALLTRVVGAFRRTVARQGFEVELVAEPATCDLPLDVAAFEGVLQNLLDNAVKFSGASRRIDVSGEVRPGGAYRIRVMDRGVGLGSGSPDRLFRRYNRGDAAREGAVPGVGLGLHIAREVVAAHGGRLRARARPGGGAVFEVELPGENEA